jgi:arginyl-tRNA synthetase
MADDQFKLLLSNILSDLLIKEKEVVLKMISKPKVVEHGDYTIPMFVFAKEIKKNPVEFAKEMGEELIRNDDFSNMFVADPIGPYLNFKVKKDIYNKEIIESVISKRVCFFENNENVVLIEFSGPNTNKPQHMGHLRNNFLGDAVGNLLKKTGNDLKKVNIINDRGIHICKSMLMYKLFGEDKTPESEGIKGDHFVGQFYSMFSKKLKEDPKYDQMARDMLKAWELGDKEIIELWDKMNGWVMNGFDHTYFRCGIEFDKLYFESEHYLKGKDIIFKALDEGVFEKDDGAIIAPLEKHGLTNAIVLKQDGTSLYMTQDIALVNERFKDFNMNEMIYVVGAEQNLHFKQLFKIVDLLKYPFAKKCKHLSYGLLLKDGSKESSRDGITYTVDSVLDMAKAKSVEMTKERNTDLSDEEIDRRAEAIALSAMKFFILKYETNKNIDFSLEQVLSFEGETGPYLLYTIARINSIFGKVNNVDFGNYKLLNDDVEEELIKLISNYRDVLVNASNHNKPSSVCRYMLDLAQKFNEYYHSTKILKDTTNELMSARLGLVRAVEVILKDACDVLGLKYLDQM